jgi:hypothetical protein
LVELGIGLHLEFGGAEATKRRPLNIMMAEMVEPVNWISVVWERSEMFDMVLFCGWRWDSGKLVRSFELEGGWRED